ncbi:MAG: winged helix-turn-helix transcriptional regulator [Ferruginibacter sp.]|nr:winged helix-turn-helix transcriptional regulator [Ferruginibacter sp.]
MFLKSINVKFAGITNEITFEEMAILYFISRSVGKDVIQRDTAELMDKNKSAILCSIDILEQKAYVKRVQVLGDSRKSVLEITESGTMVIYKMHEIFLRQDAILTDGIDETSLETCMGVLSEVLRRCK